MSDSKLTARLMARQGGIRRKSMPDGGEVYTGPTATRALRALGARAMTMDRNIFVADDFDPNDPEDAALYAHELHHQMESGGMEDGHAQHDAEEAAAQAIERMVLHRSAKGDDFGEIMRDVKSQGPGTAKVRGQDQAGKASGAEDEVMKAYKALRKQGKSHEQIVRDLAQFVVFTMMSQQESTNYRSAPVNSF
ncbi:MAG: DUF4157 domain-containing protein [Deltaproteobacteria bacterium]|nr:MAG: DUF4157 domain-containing protein [Deltaproteobacteria bacterium]